MRLLGKIAHRDVAVSDPELAWHAAGHPVPLGYRARDAQPPAANARLYQKQRGPGDGRELITVTPASASKHAEPDNAELVGAADYEWHPLTIGSAVPRHTSTKRVRFAVPTHPPNVTCGATGTGEEAATELSFNVDGERAIDIRQATSVTAILLFVSVLGQPLVLAHADGYTTAGLVMPPGSKRHEAMAHVQMLATAMVTCTAYIAFMIGEYANGARVFAAPVDYQPPAEAICATSQQRRRRAARGSAFIWCTLAALGGTPIGDAATRAVLGCEMFVKPVTP